MAGAAIGSALKNPQVAGLLEQMALQAGQQAVSQKMGGGVQRDSESFGATMTKAARGNFVGATIDLSAMALDVGMTAARYTSPVGVASTIGNTAADLGLTTERTGVAARGLSDVMDDTQNAVYNVAKNPASPGAWMELAETVASLPAKFEALGDVVADVAQDLKGFSGAMTEAAMIQDIGQIERSFQSAEATGESVLELTQAVESMKDELQPIRDSITNVMAMVLTTILTKLEEIIEFLKPVLETIVNVLTTMAKVLEKLPKIGKYFDGLSDYLQAIEFNTQPKPEGDLMGLNRDMAQVMGLTDGVSQLSFDTNSSNAPMTEDERKQGGGAGLPKMFGSGSSGGSGGGTGGGGKFGGAGF